MSVVATTRHWPDLDVVDSPDYQSRFNTLASDTYGFPQSKSFLLQVPEAESQESLGEDLRDSDSNTATQDLRDSDSNIVTQDQTKKEIDGSTNSTTPGWLWLQIVTLTVNGLAAILLGALLVMQAKLSKELRAFLSVPDNSKDCNPTPSPPRLEPAVILTCDGNVSQTPPPTQPEAIKHGQVVTDPVIAMRQA